jgi:predicted kinase
VPVAFTGFVVVSGPPASGKSTLAPALATALDLPLLAKDVIKDVLVEVLGAPDLPRSRELGGAAVRVLLAVARTAGRGVLDSVWHDDARAPLAALPGSIVEVFCRCDPALLRARFDDRSGRRDGGYFDAERSADERWNEQVGRPLAGGWPVIDVDTTGPVDVEAVAEQVRQAC